jgi:hypothetical protein
VDAADELGGEKRAPERRWGAPLLARMASLDASTQASVPGLYAWVLTVAPAAWTRGGSAFARGASITALLALAGGIAAERRWGARGRFAAMWVFVLASALVWISAPNAMGPQRLEGARGVAGMLGWALYAFACAAPALRRDELPAPRVVPDEPLRPRTRVRRGDAAYMAVAAVVAAALQAVGWRVITPERAILVRFVALASGLALISAATTIALARHGHRTRPPARARMGRAMPYLILLLLAASVMLVWLRG